MPEERLVSITSSLHLAPDDVARHTFGSVRRGFDPNEVRAYLESVAAGLRTVAEREQQLLEDLADAERRAANPVLDEPTLTAALGTETARVLHSAHEVAAEMVAKAEAEADRLLTDARAEIDQHRTTTETDLEERAAASEAAATELRERTNQQVAAGLEAARLEAEELLSQARDQCRAMVDEAQGLRARVLADLAKRRKVLHAQIEQLRAGRARLAETVQDVRRSIDVIADDLFAAEDNARLAAEAAGREAAARTDDATPEQLATELLAEEADSATERAQGVVVEGGGDDAAGPTGSDGAPVGLVDLAAGVEVTDDLLDVPEESVDALFAKLRAASSAPSEPDELPTPEAQASPVEAPPAEPATEAVESTPVPEAPPKRSKAAKASKVTPAAKSRAVESPTAEPAQPVAEDEGATADDDAVEPPEARNPQAIRRDELIEPVVKALSRRLKRMLQDNQNELLDALRSKNFQWSTDLLPDETEHVDAVATATLPALEQAAAAGVSFVGVPGSAGPPTDTLVGMGHELAESVIGPLRRRLAAGEGLDGAEESVVADHVGSAFREWKGERIERLAGDHVVAAFSAGSMAAVAGKKSALLEWVAVSDSGDAPCPDCEDNGLNGTLRPGEAFPTGHLHPPAHPGCRCLLVSTST